MVEVKMTGREGIRWVLARKASVDVLLALNAPFPSEKSLGDVMARVPGETRWTVIRRLKELRELGLAEIDVIDGKSIYRLSGVGRPIAKQVVALDREADNWVVPPDAASRIKSTEIGTNPDWRGERDLGKAGPESAPVQLLPLKANQIELLSFLAERQEVEVEPTKWQMFRALSRRRLVDLRGEDPVFASINGSGKEALVAQRVKRLASARLPNDVNGRGNKNGGPRKGIGDEIAYQASIARAENGGALVDREALKELRKVHGISLLPRRKKDEDMDEDLVLEWAWLEGRLSVLEPLEGGPEG